MIDPDPQSVADHVLRTSSALPAPMNAYWLSVSGPRDEYAEALKAHLLGSDTTVVVVRSGGFDNPNSLMQDLARLIDSHRDHLATFFSQRPAIPERIGLVLLARSELRIPQSSSPVIWPEWVPTVGGREISCFIQDITRSVDVALDSPELGLERLCRAIYDLEWALARRLKTMRDARPQAQTSMWEMIRGNQEHNGIDSFLESVTRALSSEGTIESYRPTGRGARSVCGRLWVRMQMREPRAVAPLANALSEALGLEDLEANAVPSPTLFSVLSRSGPSAQDALRSEQLARDILVTNANACQLITCAAHAGDYGRYPLGLLQGVVDELHRGVTGLESFINTLPR